MLTPIDFDNQSCIQTKSRMHFVGVFRRNDCCSRSLRMRAFARPFMS